MKSNFLTALGDKVTESILTLWDAFISFLPGFITALIVFIVGWIIAVAVGRLVGQLVKALKIDSMLEKIGLKSILDRANLKLDTGRFINELIKWFIILAALMVSVDILELSEVTSFLGDILLYIPKVIIAALILLAGVMIANFMEKVVVASVEAVKLKNSAMLGTFAKWFVLVFAFFSALMELQIASAQVLFTGLIAALAIAFGLAFGLGGKDMAADFLKKAKDSFTARS